MCCPPQGIIRTAVAGLMVWSLLGCAGHRSPTISLAQVAVTESSDEALSLAFVLELKNPRNEALDLYEFTYSLAIDGRPVYQGRRAAEATLSAAGTRQLTIPAVVPFARLGWTPAERAGQVTYALTGTVLYSTPGDLARLLFETGVRRPKISFAHRGQVRLRTGP
ncbi:MAG: LEA type 2 family protein [Phycisphaerales bacterium]|nr:LEA type 2 family protein [Planctomycetota bacterium]